MHIFGRPDSHLSCCHQQCADRTEEKQTHNPLKLRQFLFTGPVWKHPPAASHELCRIVYPPDKTINQSSNGDNVKGSKKEPATSQILLKYATGWHKPFGRYF